MLQREQKLLAQVDKGKPVYFTVVVAGDTLRGIGKLKAAKTLQDEGKVSVREMGRQKERDGVVRLRYRVEKAQENPGPLMTALIGGAAGAMGGAVGGRAIDRVLDRIIPHGEEEEDRGPDTIIIENPTPSNFRTGPRKRDVVNGYWYYEVTQMGGYWPVAYIRETKLRGVKSYKPVWYRGHGEMKAARTLNGALGVIAKNWRTQSGQNPQQNGNGAAKLAREFHGRDNRETTEVIERLKIEDDLAELGSLVQLDVEMPNGDIMEIGFDWTDEDMVRLTSNPKGTQLYLLGGDQSLDLPDLKGVKGLDKVSIPIGPVVRITYYADKHHLSGPKQQKRGMQYYHDFGEESGEVPTLIYDRINKKLSFSGGEYKVKDAGIVN